MRVKIRSLLILPPYNAQFRKANLKEAALESRMATCEMPAMERAGASQGMFGGGGGGGEGRHKVGGTCQTEDGCVALPCSSGQSNFMGRSSCLTLPTQTDDFYSQRVFCEKKKKYIKRKKNTVFLLPLSILFSLLLPSNEEIPQFSRGKRSKGPDLQSGGMFIREPGVKER